MTNQTELIVDKTLEHKVDRLMKAQTKAEKHFSHLQGKLVCKPLKDDAAVLLKALWRLFDFELTRAHIAQIEARLLVPYPEWHNVPSMDMFNAFFHILKEEVSKV